MIRKIIFTNFFSEFIHQVPKIIQVQKDLAEEVFLIWHYITTLSQNAADKILKTPCKVYDIYIFVQEVLLSKLYYKF